MNSETKELLLFAVKEHGFLGLSSAWNILEPWRMPSLGRLKNSAQDFLKFRSPQRAVVFGGGLFWKNRPERGAKHLNALQMNMSPSRVSCFEVLCFHTAFDHVSP